MYKKTIKIILNNNQLFYLVGPLGLEPRTTPL